jgi:DNA-binding beta-propeller fold protein YncE
MIIGTGEYSYEVVDGWAELPPGWSLGDVSGVAVDQQDNVFVFNRGPHPMMVFDPAGRLLATWGEDLFNNPHAIHFAPDQTIYCTDDGDHMVYRCSPDGRVLHQIGTRGKASPFMSGAPFNRCTHTALSPDGYLYVSDGYGNARVHKYSPAGERVLSWGEPGAGPGQFNVPHNITCDPAGFVYVADRENHRVQVFDGTGRVEAIWNNVLHRPSALYTTPDDEPVCYVGEIGPYFDYNLGAPNLGPRISILSSSGEVLARLGTTPSAGVGPGQFVSPHGICVDSHGDIYVGEVAVTAWPRLFPDTDMPASVRSLHKLIRVGPSVAGREPVVDSPVS